MSDVLVDRCLQFGHAGEHSSAQTFGRDVAKESLHHVQPRRRGRREVHVKSWVFGQPLLNSRVLVGGVVVGDQVQRLSLGRLAVDFAQELQPLRVDVALLAPAATGGTILEALCAAAQASKPQVDRSACGPCCA